MAELKFKSSGHVKKSFSFFQNKIDGIKVLAYQNPAKATFHLAQDALSIQTMNSQVFFSIADGVSVVNGTKNNQSAYVSYLLSKLVDSDNNDLEYKLVSIKKNILANNILGASTLIFGVLDQLTRSLSLSMIGSHEDIGYIYIKTNGQVNRLKSKHKHFFPNTTELYNTSYNNIDGILITSDGVTIDKNLAEYLLNYDQSFNSKTFRKLIPTSLDDQSLILINIVPFSI